MNVGTALTIARKELMVISRKKSIILYTILFPILLSLGFSIIVNSQIASSSGLPDNYELGLESLTFLFVVLAAIVPSSIAAYSVVGEKIEKSLEPLLATPTTDGEILLGKSLAAFIPPILAIWAGAIIFMSLSDYLLFNLLSSYYFPNWNATIMLLLLAPLASIFGIELAVIASSKISDVRGANQIGGLMFIPFMGVFLAGVEGLYSFSIDNLLILSLAVIAVDIVLGFLSISTFNRERILTKWK